MSAGTSISIGHPLVQTVDRTIFVRTFVADCMTHACRCQDEAGRGRADACCQHGADVYPSDKDAILRRAEAIAAVMPANRQAPADWFDDRDPVFDPEPPSGLVIRTATQDPDDESSGCVFLDHDGPRGCGLHRAAIVHGFDPADVKPFVCRMYPLSLDGGELGLSSDFERYSCADGAGPTVYRLMRQTLLDTFGPELLARLDRAERQCAPRRLPIVAEI
jgi:hypothetical protein